MVQTPGGETVDPCLRCGLGRRLHWLVLPVPTRRAATAVSLGCKACGPCRGSLMPAELIRCDLDPVYPKFRDRMFDVLARCKARGSPMFWTSGTRFMDEQATLRKRYLRRLSLQNTRVRTPAMEAELAALLKVGAGRAAAPGFSGHQFGIAADCTHDSDPAKAGLQPDWHLPNYRVYVEELARAGLASGASYGDAPHANLMGFTSGDELGPLRSVWAAATGTPLERLRAVWDYLDSLA